MSIILPEKMIVNLIPFSAECIGFFRKDLSFTTPPATSKGRIYSSPQRAKKKEFARTALFKVEFRQGNPLGILCDLA
jgi:hypothetical protein